MGDAKPGSYTAAFTEAIVKEAEDRPELVAITAAMPDSTGLLPFEERFPDRFFDVGIAEQHAVTAAAGMAMGGLRPVVAIYSTFLTRAFDQVNLDVGLHGQPVVFCLDRAGITGDDGASHHGVLDMVLLHKVPGMTMFAPSSYRELGHDAARRPRACTDGPAAIRWPKTVPPDDDATDEVGSGLPARKVRAGARRLHPGRRQDAGRGPRTPPTSWPPRASRRRCGTCGWSRRSTPRCSPTPPAHPAVVTVEDGFREGGVGAAIAGRLAARRRRLPRSRCIGMPVQYIPHGKPDAILAELGLDAPGVAASPPARRPPSQAERTARRPRRRDKARTGSPARALSPWSPPAEQVRARVSSSSGVSA